MLELLLYCHMIANLKYAGPIAAVADFIGSAKTQCRRLLAGAISGRKQAAAGFDCWTERELMRSLDRLEAYVSSMA